MYVYQSAKAVGKDIQDRWLDVDISNMLMYDIFDKYRKVYVWLTNPYLDAPVVIDLETLRLEFSFSEDSFNNILIQIDNRTLTPVTPVPTFRTKYVKFSDAFRAGYKITPQSITASQTANLPDYLKTSLRLDKPNTDMEVFYKHCLVSVNGFFHRTDGNGLNAFVVDGAKSLFKSRQNQLGITSFLDIGQIEQVPITESMIYAQAEDSNLRKRTYVKLNKDITNKTVLLVLGGYLLFPDHNSFWQTGDDTFAINFTSMPLLERYYESFPYIDFEELGLPKSTNNESLINIEEFYSDAVLKKYMMMPQSFFVIVDTPSLFVNKIYIRDSALPGMFTAYKEPTYPLIVGNGRIAEYWKTYEDGHWSVTVLDSYLHNKVLTHRPLGELVTVSNSDVPLRTYYNSRGFLLELGKDI